MTKLQNDAIIQSQETKRSLNDLEVLKINPIKTYRLKNPEVTQQQIADKAGVERAYIGLLENGKRGKAIRPKTAKRIAAAIGCDWEDFYREEGDNISRSPAASQITD